MKSEDTFSNAASYENFVGRWSRLVAPQFIAWLKIAPRQTWLDVGAGTGILTQVILRETSPSRVVATDLSPEYIELARQRVLDDRVEFRVEDAVKTGAESRQFDVAVAGLVLNFLPDPAQGAKNMTQAVRQGGTVAAYVWDYGGRMEMMRHFWEAAIKVDPIAKEMDSGQRFSICDPENLRTLFQSLALETVEVIAIDVETRFKNLDDYWLPFLGAQGSVSKYLRGASDEIRAAIHNQLQNQLPITENGEIPLIARAWAVKGKKGSE